MFSQDRSSRLNALYHKVVNSGMHSTARTLSYYLAGLTPPAPAAAAAAEAVLAAAAQSPDTALKIS
jgi:hypothetical protein